jgi:uncharacterized protein with beta-barrel porin domain
LVDESHIYWFNASSKKQGCFDPRRRLGSKHPCFFDEASSNEDAVWAQASGRDSNWHAGDDAARSQVQTWTVGAQHGDGQRWLLGAAASTQTSTWQGEPVAGQDVWGRAQGRQNALWLFGNLYGEAGYLHAAVNWGTHTQTVNRPVWLGEAHFFTGGQENGSQGQASLDAGHVFAVGAGTVQPQVGLAYDWLHRGSLDEPGADGFSLVAPGGHEGLWTATTDLDGRLPLAWGNQVAQLQVDIGLSQALGNPGGGFMAAYAGLPDNAFEVKGWQEDRTSEHAQMRIHWPLSSRMELHAGYGYDWSGGEHGGQWQAGVHVQL